MTERTHKDWRELCAAVVNENDPKKLDLLIQELTEALDDSEKPETGTLQTPATNSDRSSTISPDAA